MPVDTDATMQDPHAIYQEWLDVTSAAVVAADNDTFVTMVSYPMIMRTATAVAVIETPEEMAADITNLSAALRDQQVTDYIRLVKQARYLDETTIEGWHTTYVLRNATSVTPNYNNRMILRMLDGQWKLSESENEIAAERFPMTILRGAPDTFKEKWAAAKADIVATQARAEPIYKAFLKSLTAAVNAHDFEIWSGHYTYPHSIHYDATDHTAHTPADVKAFFDIMMETMKAKPGTRMERVVRYAEFLSDHRIVGYHDTLMTRDGKPNFGPVKCRFLLTLTGDRWACSSVTNSLSQETLSDEDEFRLSVTLPTMRAIQQRMRK